MILVGYISKNLSAHTHTPPLDWSHFTHFIPDLLTSLTASHNLREMRFSECLSLGFLHGSSLLWTLSRLWHLGLRSRPLVWATGMGDSKSRDMGSGNRVP